MNTNLQNTNVHSLSDAVIRNNEIPHENKLELLDAIRKLRSPEENRWNFWYVILALALIALSVPVYALLHYIGNAQAQSELVIPDALLSIAATSVGALAGFLMHRGRSAPGGPDAHGKDGGSA